MEDIRFFGLYSVTFQSIYLKKTLKFNIFLENLYSWIRIQEVSLSVDLDPRH